MGDITGQIAGGGAGSAQKIGATAIPFIIVPTGSMANNGAITLGTALAAIYPSSYVFLPAAAISAGSAAGWYYCAFSSTTVGQVFNNTYTSGMPAIPASPTAFATTGPGAYTGVTTQQNMVQISVPGNTLGPNGTLRYQANWSALNNADAKTVGVAYGSGALFSTGLASLGFGAIKKSFQNRGVTNSQVSDAGSGGFGSGTGAAAPVYTAVDSTAAQLLSFTGLLATATDYVVLESVLVEVLSG